MRVISLAVCLRHRWNVLAADDAGITLQLMPMLLGFLTYKGAVIARGALDLFADLAGGDKAAATQQQAAAEAAAASGEPGVPCWQCWQTR